MENYLLDVLRQRNEKNLHCCDGTFKIFACFFQLERGGKIDPKLSSGRIRKDTHIAGFRSRHMQKLMHYKN